MTVEMNNRHRPISLINTPQQGQCDGMVTTKGNDTGKGLSSTRNTRFIRVSVRLAHQDTIVSFFDLFNCPGVVVSVARLALSSSIHTGAVLSAQTYEVTGTSPQSKIRMSLVNGFACKGTL